MNDDYDLQRFVTAQDPVYDDALTILRQGMMCTPYMEFIFPRLTLPEQDDEANNAYGLGSLDEARAYLAFPVLGNRYRECLDALSWLADTTASQVFGEIDTKKLHASLTLFAEAGNEPVLRTMLDIWFSNLADEATVRQLDLAT